MGLNNLKAYELIEEREISDIKSKGYLLRHKKTGAKVVCLSNDDKNKVFYIGFRTPPFDSTGVPHIIEHSVLCGSDKYPVKDPFIELAKGSLNTFLNAMTFPDKTVYPVASCNDRDFRNLMDVYLDAVFHPNIYKNDKTFKQEGWHYEIESKDEPITLNGVVYSEMKGAFSSPEDILDRHIFNSLYPDTCYGVESGGDPEFIPTLTYDAFLDFHKRYYHPSNSYIYLYGDTDFEDQLNYIDEEYLSKYDYLEIDSSIKIQKGFESISESKLDYPITNEEPESENTFLSYNFVIGDVLDRNNYLAFQILDYALLSAPGAVLKQALLDRGIAKDVDSSFENGIAQTYFSIIARNTDYDKKDEFISCIKEVLGDVATNGIDEKSLRAGLNVFEFRYREADFGPYPKGLMYGLQALDSWLYDDSKPFIHIEELETFEFLKNQIGTGYYEDLIRKYFLDNTHASIVALCPKRGLLAENDKALADKLQSYKDSLGNEEIEKLITETAELKEYQQREDSPEALECIPLLEVSDIEKKAEEFVNEVKDVEGKTLLTHDVFTNGIGYLSVAFNAQCVSLELLPYLGILKSCLGLVNTKNYTYAELANEIYLNTGGLYPGGSVYPQIGDNSVYKNYVDFSAKIFYDKLDFAFGMIEEIAYTSDFSDKKRMRELICMIKSRLNSMMMSAGHSVAMKRSMMGLMPVSFINEYMSGIEFYRVVEEIEADFDNRADELIAKLNEVSSLVFNRDNLELIDYTCEKEQNEEILRKGREFIVNCPERKCEPVVIPFERNTTSEAFTTGAQVCYVGKAGLYLDDKHKYTGALRVLKTILGYDYLWLKVRVLGGAYGCFSQFTTNGAVIFTSYRDPNVEKTLEVYNEAADYLDNFEASERDLTKYIIGTISELDIPLTPSMKGSRSRDSYICKKTYDLVQRERDEVLNLKVEDIRNLAGYLRNIKETEKICVIGGEEIINKDNTKFDVVQTLFRN